VQYPDYKPALDNPPLSDAELQALDELLAASSERAREAPMNVEMLDGYLTALLLAPTPVAQLPGGQWLPPIWGGDGPDPAPFASGKQKKHAIVMVLRHLHAIDRALHDDPQGWEPIFSVAETSEREWADAEDWCIGFLQATAADLEGWGRIFDDATLGPLLVPIGLLGGDDSQLAPADRERLADPEQRDALSRQVPDAVLALVQRTR
jgi:uncharacterized protein